MPPFSCALLSMHAIVSQLMSDAHVRLGGTVQTRVLSVHPPAHMNQANRISRLIISI
jgi:hypothetical protein